MEEKCTAFTPYWGCPCPNFVSRVEGKTFRSAVAKGTIAGYHVLRCQGSPLATPFCHNLHIPHCAGTCRGWVSGGGNDAKNQASTGSISKAIETAAQFLVMGLWRGCACSGKQGK